jgi:hypothetical protein
MAPSANQLRLDKTAFRIFHSFAEAELADKEYYRSLTSAQRIEMLLILRDHFHPYSDELTEGFKRVYRVIERS